ncbi:Holliday junction branch migration DNA helicase RuvB [Candidatus Syntrophosphaera thermopropionivorans]|jgi:Holliday junction DNA helicase RuvB|uniref:Holliday junction branch migration DNA helicase RuvB n=1 Tax=Candidatus Syntrophosphaera thermopropionivorans TaxID=2593015 RepID=A0AC61QL10_9BACT|nr:Holliday junction branch migration DNA helicase RuvB [Candidatus Syntrophosphaera thermopropionivorans]MBP7932533.1 Holliday junction branch migration DNA helicase RuvB [Candidatus Syntrophosphaera sp.]TDF74600.1 Holliday junction branch migration DNA helicase RuvB [Candidatus Syntrophosphaera thermopropionivorans]HNU98039.1 Holliday junction branch migration DNA helicase RuvB [Candidatus Syntrophosphaera thermopropionivorans]
MLERINTPFERPEDKEFDRALRPRTLNEFIGQTHIKQLLDISIKAAKLRKESLDHILLYGPPGLGKTTLAGIIANELGVNITVSSGPVMEKPSDLAGILTNLQRHEVLFIDEIHRLSHIIEEYIYPAMEDFQMEIILDNGPSARTLRISIEPFTLIGATTRAGLLTPPLRDRFGIILRLDYYDLDSINQIIRRSANILGIPAEDEGIAELAHRSRGTPRIANRLLRRVRDFAQIMGNGVITRDIALQALEMLQVDNEGLDEMDKRLLSTIIEYYRGGPVGIKTLATAVGEDPGTIEEIFEPYLVQQGFLERTPQGRKATYKAYQHLGIIPSNPQTEIF